MPLSWWSSGCLCHRGCTPEWLAAVICVSSTTNSAATTGSSFMGSSGRLSLGVAVVVTNMLVLLGIIAFIIRVYQRYMAILPRVRQAVDKMITWGACLKL